MVRGSWLLLGVLAACEGAPVPKAPVEVSRTASSGSFGPAAIEPSPGTAVPPWTEGERFRVRIEQNGKVVSTADHRATLAKAPFEIVMTMRLDDTRDAFSVALHASTDPAEMAKAGRLAKGAPLSDADFGDGTGVAEEWFDKEHALFARDGHHEIMWFGEQEHRCAKAQRITHDTLSCSRTVERLIEAGGNEVAIGDVKELLLVFAKLDHRGARAVEKQRDWVVLRFE